MTAVPTDVPAEIDRRVRVLDASAKDDPEIDRISGLRGFPFVVLLGEPGIGKSTVLAAEAAHEGVPVTTVRQLMTGTQVVPKVPLFLDALDEYRIDGGSDDKVHKLANAIAALGPPRWRLTCRSEDWRKAADMAPIAKTTAGAAIVVAQLLPLDTEEAVSVLAATGEPDPDRFVRNAESFGATGFLESPLGLKLLRSAVADGGDWPANRFGLFDAATRKLAFEHNAVRAATDRRGVNEILDAAADTFLLALVTGARAVWRLNSEPPSAGDARAFITGHDLGINRDLLKDTLDTPLFRGEGGSFEPMHRTIAEFLGGRALAAAIRGSRSQPALPLPRALALITGDDGSPPTEMRGLFSWFAAHLAVGRNPSAAIRLIEQDPVSVLSYGDAAIFDSSGRRAILDNLGRSDPYFRASEVGVTSVGGLAGEDLAADFAAVLTDVSEETHRRHTVFEALTTGRPVMSLRPLLRGLVLDATRPEWQRTRAIEALLNAQEDPASLCRELFDALSPDAPSSAREAVRSRLAGHLAKGALTVADVRSVLTDYCGCAPDNMLGRLYGLQTRITAEPLPELFDDPIASWLPRRRDGDSERDHRIEVGHLLDLALASLIRSTPGLTASTLWRWIANVRREAFSNLKDATQKALSEWLDDDPEREFALFERILADDDGTGGPWLVSNKYITIVRRTPGERIVGGVLSKAASAASTAERDRLLAIAVEIANVGRDASSYWATYDLVAPTGDPGLLNRLTVSVIDDYRREQSLRIAAANEEEERQRLTNVADLQPLLRDIRSGRHAGSLDWGAAIYFERGDAPDIQRVVDKADRITAEAIAEGWNSIVMSGLGDVDAAMLGVAEAEQRRYFVEAAAVAGIYRMATENRLPVLRKTPIDLALAVLKSSWIAGGTDRSDILDRWAIDRLDADPTTGAPCLVTYWAAALGAGATDLPGLWKLQGERPVAVLGLALTTILETHRGMNVGALRSAVKAAARTLSRPALLSLARAAVSNSDVDCFGREIWELVAFVLDPNSAVDGPESGMAAMFVDEANRELIAALAEMSGVERLPTHVLTVRLLGGNVTPADERARNGRVADTYHQSETVRVNINLIAADARAEAAAALSNLLTDPALTAWATHIRHAQAQQRRAMRDGSFRHPSASAVRAALNCGPPVNALDLRAVAHAELLLLRAELRSTDTTPWKRYWNNDNGKVTSPLIENECRDHLLDRLRDRLAPYRIAAALPEARRGDETRADVLLLSGAGRNLPIEAKRHFHPAIWSATTTQLSGYAADPGADGMGIYLVFWFGNAAGPTPARPDGRYGPTSGSELEAMLRDDLPLDARSRTDIIVFDVSAPDAPPRPPRKKKSRR